jgi:hypothetical protein
MRSESYRRVVEGLDPAEATEVLLTLLGSDTYLAFTRDRRWSHDRVIGWLKQTLPPLLLAPSRRTRPARPT